MLKPIIREEGITNSERYLAKLADHTFLHLWSYPNVYTDEGVSKTKEGKELCDLLVVFRNKVIIFSDKEIGFNENVDVNVAWKRWFKRSVIKSSHQLHGAEKWIRNHHDRLYIDKKCQKKFPLKIEENNLKVHLIAVAKNSIRPASKYFSKFGENSSGSLMSIYGLSIEECYNLPFTICDLDPKKTFVHVLDEITLDLLLTHLDTISDFSAYLEAKEKAIRARFLVLTPGEEDLLAYYLSNISVKTHGDIPIPEDHNNIPPITIKEGSWTEFQSTELYTIIKDYRRKSKYWDYLLSIFSKNILNATVGDWKELPLSTHEKAVQFLASETRISRGILGHELEEKFNSVPTNRRSSRVVQSPFNTDTMYIFLFLPREKNMDDAGYRKVRQNWMSQYILVAKFKSPKIKYFVAIGTETQGVERRSEDIICAEFESDLSKKEIENSREIMKKNDILHKTESMNLSFASRENKHFFRMKKKVGRNDKCPCGSGLKYKKCCLSR